MKKTDILSRTRSFAFGAVAATALVAGAGLGGGFIPGYPADAAPLVLEQPVAMPTFADVVETVRPAVVSVRVTAAMAMASDEVPRGGRGAMPGIPGLSPDHPLFDFFRGFGDPEGRGVPGPRADRPRMSQGSGFFISGDGYIVTNHHVVRGASEVAIVLDDGETIPARVVGSDPRTDLALLKAEDDREFSYVRFAEQRSRIGDWVVAIGNPFGLGGTVTAGIVSADARDIGAGPYDEFLQIDAPINRGNSGGPTFNLRGEVVGVNTAIYSQSGGNVGIAFAIPAHVTSRVVDELRRSGEVTRGYLGVQVQPVTEQIAEAIGLDAARGALIARPQEDSPAARAGLRSGDVIVALAGEAIRDHRDLTRRVAAIAPGTRVELEILRRGERQVLSVEIGRLSDA